MTHFSIPELLYEEDSFGIFLLVSILIATLVGQVYLT